MEIRYVEIESDDRHWIINFDKIVIVEVKDNNCTLEIQLSTKKSIIIQSEYALCDKVLKAYKSWLNGESESNCFNFHIA